MNKSIPLDTVATVEGLTIGIARLRSLVAILREQGSFTDDEGDFTNDLDDLATRLASPAPTPDLSTLSQLVDYARDHGWPTEACKRIDSQVKFLRSLPAPTPVAEPVAWPRHKFWAVGEADCPQDIKAPNGELHTMRCKACGDGWRQSGNVCLANVTHPATTTAPRLPVVRVLTEERIEAVLGEAFTKLVAETGYNGGMGGRTWDLAAARAIEAELGTLNEIRN